LKRFVSSSTILHDEGVRNETKKPESQDTKYQRIRQLIDRVAADVSMLSYNDVNAYPFGGSAEEPEEKVATRKKIAGMPAVRHFDPNVALDGTRTSPTDTAASARSSGRGG